MMGFGWGMGLGGWVGMVGGLVVLVGIVVLVGWAMNGFNQAADQRSGGDRRPDPMDILRERFARGEITEAEFEQVKRALGSDR